MAKLSVNVNKVATLRNTRNLGIPSVTRAAQLCIDAGAAGITVHTRTDKRHIRPQDVFDIAELLRSHPEVEFNIEGNPFENFVELIEKVKPTQCTLVPDTPEAFTSDHGWDVQREGERLKPMIETLKSLGARVSLFMDADASMVELVSSLSVDRIELYTEPYASAFAEGRVEEVLPAYVAAAESARSQGLGVNAGHDLNLENLPTLLEAIPFIAEVSIGHALIADALEWGLPETVRRYLDCTRKT